MGVGGEGGAREVNAVIMCLGGCGSDGADGDEDKNGDGGGCDNGWSFYHLVVQPMIMKPEFVVSPHRPGGAGGG